MVRLLTTLFCLFLLMGCASPPEAPPNIVFFLVDDLGWMDTTPYGSGYYETPHIDRLRRSGMLFTEAYTVSPVCSPTRASILTGKYPTRFNFIQASGHLPPLPPDAPLYPPQRERLQWLMPESRRVLPLEEFTFAEALRKAGYRTAHLGKWHLGRGEDVGPRAQGFDVVFHGSPDHGPPTYFSPYGFAHQDFEETPEGTYLTDHVTDQALHFLDEADGPFLLHLWHYGVHRPLEAKGDEVARFEDRQDARGRQDNPVMAAMIRSVDDSVGRVLDRLEALGLRETTLVLFFSDNGGARDRLFEPYQRFPTDNHPLRGAKGTIYEGGIRVPLIASWPGRIEADSRTASVVSSVDFYPTLLEVAGVSPKPEQILDGVSLGPVFAGEELAPRPVFSFAGLAGIRALPGLTVRLGRWKLVRYFGSSPWFPRRHELYDLENDLSESTDLASHHPDVVLEMEALAQDFLDTRVQHLPIPNPAYDPRLSALGLWQPEEVPIRFEDGILRLGLSEIVETGWSGLWQEFLPLETERLLMGAFRVRLRVRAEAPTRGRLVTTAVDSLGDPKTSFFDVGTDFEDILFDLDLDELPVRIHLEFLHSHDVLLDEILIESLDHPEGAYPSFKNRWEWTFDPVPPGPPL